MKRNLVICILSVFCLSGYAQQGTQKGEFNVKNFPEVSFVWNEYNPDTLTANRFTIKENTIELVAPQVECLKIDSIPPKNKSILFLWEAQSTREKQVNFTETLLYYFLDKNIANNDTTITFNVAIFNCKQGNESVFKSKSENFISNKDSLKNIISNEASNIKLDKTLYRKNPDKSDLLSAIMEGLDLIKKEPQSNTRAIVVITEGFSLTEVEMSLIINSSLQNRIPVYVVYYPMPKGESNSLAQLSKATYGQFILSDGSDADNAKTTREALLNCFNELNRHHYGQDYKITFTSLLKRDGKTYPLTLISNGTTYPIISYKTADFSLFVWAKAHLIWFLIILIILMAAITLGTIFGIKFFKKKLANIRGQKQEEERKKASQRAEQEQLKRKLNETQEELKRQQKAAEQGKKQIQEQEQEERLSKLMRTKNLQPRLIVVNNGNLLNIQNVTTTIGREEDNDIVFDNETVSKHHAQIVFNGSCFEICDLQSSNGIIVNRQYVENTELKNADIIQLGEIVMKFYL
jgi:pSer/pThr/pTyr-binding forkhead associated (FHA) protein